MIEDARPWQVLRRETIYDSPWVRLHRDDVRLPDGSVIDGHHVVDFPRPAVCVVPIGDDGRILLIEHYRFITDTTGWEVPAGRIDEGEELEIAAARELSEETGYAAERLEYMGAYHPCNGSTNLTFHVYFGYGLRQIGELTDTNEVLGVAWFRADEVWAMIDTNQIHDGLTLTALLWYFARSRRDTMTG
ncbi:MAG TPA: NUDIX hydrolase [Roseiflexaceae bacterium]|nr:NUDIX hydrolase [Roseiflexaceae bacterium]